MHNTLSTFVLLFLFYTASLFSMEFENFDDSKSENFNSLGFSFLFKKDPPLIEAIKNKNNEQIKDIIIGYYLIEPYELNITNPLTTSHAHLKIDTQLQSLKEQDLEWFKSQQFNYRELFKSFIDSETKKYTEMLKNDLDENQLENVIRVTQPNDAKEIKIYFFGENHRNVENLRDNMLLLKHLSQDKKHRLLLQEGVRAKTSPIFEPFTGMIISMIAAALENKIDLPYDPDLHATIKLLVLYFMKELGLATMSEIDESGTQRYQSKINDIEPFNGTAQGWEPKEDTKESEKRNQSLADEIKDLIGQDTIIFITAGAMHLPYYEYLKYAETINMFSKFNLMNNIDIKDTFPRYENIEDIDNFYNFFGITHHEIKLTNKFKKLRKTKTIFEAVKNDTVQYIFYKNNDFSSDYKTRENILNIILKDK